MIKHLSPLFLCALLLCPLSSAQEPAQADTPAAPTQDRHEPRYKEAIALIATREEANMKKGIPMLTELAESAYAPALDSLAFCYLTGLGVERNDEAGAKLYAQAVDQGYTPSIKGLAECYQKGLGVEKDIAYAQHLYMRLVSMGDYSVTSIIGSYYAQGLYGVSDSLAAVAWYRLGYEHDDLASSRQMAIALNNGQGVEKDELAAYKIYKKLATERQDGRSWGMMGLYHWAGKVVDMDKELSIKYFRKGAAANDPDSKRYLAYAYRDGQAVSKQSATAFSMLQELAYEGQAIAQLDAALMLKEGDGIPQNFEEAYKLFKMASDQGFMPATLELAKAKLKGRGCELDEAGAIKYLELCEQNGSSAAALLLVICQREGKGMEANPAKAHEMLIDLAQKKCFGANYELGRDLEKGRGVKADPAQAQKYYQKAQDEGDTRAKEKLH
ncbi:MAG: tetratricopeptide repeat protein [Akkermansia sp.]